MHRMRAVLIPLCLAACGGGDAPPAQADLPPLPAGATVADAYAPELGVDLSAMTRSASGLYVLDVAQGSGDAARAGVVARVHYTGWLPDGTQFDSSVGSDPFTFALGAGRVIAGWDEGVIGMRPGGKRRLVIPPALGYGEGGYPGAIPPNATLVFDVELIEILPGG